MTRPTPTVAELVSLAKSVLAANDSTGTKRFLAQGIVAILDVDQSCGIEPSDICRLEASREYVTIEYSSLLSPDEARYAAITILHACDEAEKAGTNK